MWGDVWSSREELTGKSFRVRPVEKQLSTDLTRDVHSKFPTTSPQCGRCHNPTVDVLIMKTDVIWWWCAACGDVWGQPQKALGSGGPDRIGRACLGGGVAVLGSMFPT